MIDTQGKGKICVTCRRRSRQYLWDDSNSALARASGLDDSVADFEKGRLVWYRFLGEVYVGCVFRRREAQRRHAIGLLEDICAVGRNQVRVVMSEYREGVVS